jgi:hypothetical protein
MNIDWFEVTSLAFIAVAVFLGTVIVVIGSMGKGK